MFKLHDRVKITGLNRVFRVCGFTDNSSMVIPEDWLIDEDGNAVNPRFCKLYEGATSALSAQGEK